MSELWRRHRRPLTVALVFGALAVLAVLAALTGLPGARVVAGGCALVATVCLIEVKHRVLGGSDDRGAEYPGE